MPFIKHTPWSPQKICNSPEHDPPKYIVLKPGIHIWKCPRCGQQQTIRISQHTL